jgi:hypothetical protein
MVSINTMFMFIYCMVLYYIFNITLGYIYLDRTIDPADKWIWIKGAYFLYFGTIIALFCQFSGLMYLR